MKVKTMLLGLAGMTALAAGPAFADRGHGHGHGKPHFAHPHHRPVVHYRPIAHYRPVVVVPPRVVYRPAPVYYSAPAPVYYPPASYGAGAISIRLNLPL